MLSIVTVLRDLGVRNLDANTTYPKQVSCPFHGKDINPSMRVYPATDSAYCFTCHKSWRPVEAYADGNNLSYRDALKELSQRYGDITVKNGKAFHQTPYDRLDDILARAIKKYPNNAKVLDIVSRSARGTPEDKIRDEISPFIDGVLR